MPNSQNHPNNDSNSGFSLMSSLGGVTGSNQNGSGSASARTPATRLREGYTAMVSSPSNNSASSSYAKNSSSPSGPPVPLGRASDSFTSSSNYNQQLRQQQQQQQRRRVPAYRTGNQSNNVPPHKLQQQNIFSGILPNNSMDSGDRTGARDSGAGSILKASSFDDCYKQNAMGFHDAFALLSPQKNDNTPVGDDVGVGTNASSPAREQRRNFFPSSPLRPKSQYSPEHKMRPASSGKSPHVTIDGDSSKQRQRPISSMSSPVQNRRIGSVSSPPNTPPSTGSPAMFAYSNNFIGSTSGPGQISSSKMGSPNKELYPSVPPPPPSGTKSKHSRDGNDTHATNAAAASTSTRHASPMAASRMKNTLQKTWNKAMATTKGGISGGHHARQRSKGSGSYSEAVNEALQIEGDDVDGEIGAIVVDTGVRKSAGASAIESSSSQGGIEVISPASINSFNYSGGKIGKRLNRLRTRTRSPSPIRDLEGNSLSVDGGNVNTGNNESKITSNEVRSNNHDENESAITTPSFFGKSPNIRAMSPARMKKNLKKRLLAIPPSSRRDDPPQSQQTPLETSSAIQSLEQSRQRDSPRLPLHPSTEVISNHSEEDDALGDMANLSLVNTSMSFEVDDYETSILEVDELHVDSDATTEIASNKSGSISTSSIGVNSSSSKYVDGRSIDEKLHPDSIFESDEFVVAMGGSNEAALATNYIRTGDSLCTIEKHYDRAIPAYYAGLGAILSRVRRWGLNQHGSNVVGKDTAAPGTFVETSNILQEDFRRIACSTDMNILLLAMSSILLRAGNAHFHLNHWETACQDYFSAQTYRSLRFSALTPETGSRRSSNENDKKLALIIDLYHDEWYEISAVLDGLILNNLASAKSKRQMYDEARVEYTEALRIKQSALQALHGGNSQESEPPPASLSKHVKDDDLVSDIATTLHNIGLLRSKCGEPKKAEKAFTQSLSLRVKKFGLDDPGVSTTLRALGDLYFNEKRYDDSFRSYKESLRICKLHCGKSDLNAAELYYNIGLVFYSKGPYSKSKVSIIECLRIRREQCGNKSLHTASALYLLGLISSAMGEYDDAIDQFEEALAIRRDIIGIKSPNHLLVINLYVALGNVHQLNGDLDSAMELFSLSLKERSERLGKHHPCVSEVLQLIGVAYIEADEYSKALKTLEEALHIRQGLLGPSMEVAETLDSLGLLYFKSGDTEKAVELSEESLSVLKTAVGFDHVLVSKVLKNIGDYYQNAEVYEDAIEAYSESIRVMALWYGRDHTSLSEVLNEMGVTRFKKGDYMIARQSFSQALRIMRADKNAPNKSVIFQTLTHLGHALYKNKDLKLAAETYLESFNIQVSIITGEENLGIQGFSNKLTYIAKRATAMEEDDDDCALLSESLGGIASILRYLGLVYQEQGDIETALTVNKLSLSVRLSQPFREYSAIALMAETIAMFEFKRTNLNSALEYFNQALNAKKSYQGDSTIDVARTVNNLANIHFSLGNLDDAMKLYQDALEIKRLCLGNDSDEVANTLNNIAHVMVTAGREQDALQAYHNVVRIRQDRYGKNHSSVATTLASMGDVYIKLGKLEIAMTYFEQCVRIQRLNQEHCDERVLENLASIYGKLGEWHKAESAFNEIVQLKRSSHGEDSLNVAKSLDLLAVSYIEQDRCVDSIEHLKEALRIRKACLGVEDDEILASLNKLAFVYKSCEMTAEMMDVKAEFDRIQNLRKKK